MIEMLGVGCPGCGQLVHSVNPSTGLCYACWLAYHEANAETWEALVAEEQTYRLDYEEHDLDA